MSRYRLRCKLCLYDGYVNSIYRRSKREGERERERERRKEPATSHRIRVSDPWTRPERSAINNTCFSIQPRDKEY